VFPWSTFRAELRDSPHGRGAPLAIERHGEAQVCVRLPASRAADAQYEYRVVALTAQPTQPSRSTTLWVHLYDAGASRGWVVAGAER
jgi:hypothetical protein